MFRTWFLTGENQHLFGSIFALRYNQGLFAAIHRTQHLFNQYLDAKKELGESVDSLKFASFRGQIEKQIQAIKEKTGAQDVEFSVVRKEGKVTLSAKPKKS